MMLGCCGYRRGGWCEAGGCAKRRRRGLIPLLRCICWVVNHLRCPGGCGGCGGQIFGCQPIVTTRWTLSGRPGSAVIGNGSRSPVAVAGGAREPRWLASRCLTGFRRVMQFPMFGSTIHGTRSKRPGNAVMSQSSADNHGVILRSWEYESGVHAWGKTWSRRILRAEACG